MQRGHFIVVDGGDGAGKDTLIERLGKYFPDAIYIRDPGGTEIGTHVRELLQYKENLAKRAELFLFLASRNQLVEEKIRPALDAGKLVISNRFDLSTVAYQIYGRERVELLEMVKTMSEFARADVVPDLYILLDIPPEVGIPRSRHRGEVPTRFEKEALAFHKRVRAGYLKHIGEYPKSVIIDATQSEDMVEKEALVAIQKIESNA